MVLLRWRTIVGSKTLKPAMPGHALFFRQDCRVFAFQVTDFKPDCVKIRILASAPERLASAKLFASRFATLPSTLSLHFEAVKFACFAIEPEQINGENHQQGHRSNDTIPKDRLPKPVVEVPKS